MTINLPPLKDYQQEVLFLYQKYPKDHTIVVVSPRQCGKSVSLQNLLIYASLTESNSVSIAVAPISAQSRKNFNDMIKIALPIIKNFNSSLMEVEFINGSKVLFKSAESGDNLRGLTVKKSGVLCIDEFAYIKKDFYYSVLLPMVNVFRGSIFGFSTPRTKEGIFWELYNKGLSDEEQFITLDWTNYDLSEYLPDSLLEQYAKIMPKQAFLNEYKAQFSDSEGSVFNGFKDCVGEAKLNKNLGLYIGVDVGAGLSQDYTVLTYGQVSDKVYILEQKAFNNKNVTETLDFIQSEVIRYTKLGIRDIFICVEKNNMGIVHIQLLQDLLNDTNASIWSFTTTNKSKSKIISQTEVLFEQKKIVLPNDQKLLNELAIFECKMNQNGIPTYSAPAGYHDDRVMSLAICINSLYNELL